MEAVAKLAGDRSRDVGGLRVPVWGWLPPDIQAAVKAHNAKCDQLSQAWDQHDKKAAELYRSAMAGPTMAWAKVQELKAAIFDSTSDCLKQEAEVSCTGDLDLLLDRVQAACNAALEHAIANQVKVEAQQIKGLLKLNGLDQETAGELLPRYEGQARQTEPYRQATAQIEERRAAGQQLAQLARSIKAARASRWDAIRKAIHQELVSAMFGCGPIRLSE
jgi:hypothetical protein